MATAAAPLRSSQPPAMGMASLADLEDAPWLGPLGAAPPPPRSPLPVALTAVPPGMTRVVNQRTGEAKDFPSNRLSRSTVSGATSISEGIARAAEPNLREKAGGAHQIISGALEAASPMIVPSLVAAPARTVATVGAAVLSQAAVEKGLSHLGLPKEYAQVAGDLAGIIAGSVAHKSAGGIKNVVEPLLRERLSRGDTVPPDALPKSSVPQIGRAHV